MSAPKAVGAIAETLALQWLEQQGLVLIARNWHCRYGELDLVMQDSEVLAFIEVRYRKRAQFGGAEASVNARKQQRLVQAAQSFLQAEKAWANWPCRFDVVALCTLESFEGLNWIRNAFEC